MRDTSGGVAHCRCGRSNWAPARPATVVRWWRRSWPGPWVGCRTRCPRDRRAWLTSTTRISPATLVMLFRFLVFMDAAAAEPTQELHGRESLAPVFDDLNQYVATMHFNGQSTILLDGDRATGESYCLAHHLKVGQDGQRTMMIASIRYLDELAKQDGQWLFAERRLMVNWTETRPFAT